MLCPSYIQTGHRTSQTGSQYELHRKYLAQFFKLERGPSRPILATMRNLVIDVDASYANDLVTEFSNRQNNLDRERPQYIAEGDRF